MSIVKYFESNYKVFGYTKIDERILKDLNAGVYRQYIQVLYLPAGFTLKVDFTTYKTEMSSFFFVSSNQVIQILESAEGGHFMFFNADFYCVQVHDAEVACNGILFNNVYNLAMTSVVEEAKDDVAYLFEKLTEELDGREPSHEEMIRTYLKQLIILATRMWKTQELSAESYKVQKEIEIYRSFSMLVEAQFREEHTVAAYALQLELTPKNLSAKLSRLNLPSPSDIIKDRVVLEAKRLLCYTASTVKEVAHQLGFDDPAYFNRLFAKRVGASPIVFKKRYMSVENVQR